MKFPRCLSKFLGWLRIAVFIILKLFFAFAFLIDSLQMHGKEEEGSTWYLQRAHPGTDCVLGRVRKGGVGAALCYNMSCSLPVFLLLLFQLLFFSLFLWKGRCSAGCFLNYCVTSMIYFCHHSLTHCLLTQHISLTHSLSSLLFYSPSLSILMPIYPFIPPYHHHPSPTSPPPRPPLLPYPTKPVPEIYAQ